MNSPLILVTNDDGIYAPGLRHLIEILNKIGKVIVVAPDKSQSAQSHAITLDKPIRCEKIIIDKGKQLEFICSGTPVDCIKLALSRILDKKPDICISGINHGSNASVNVIYSGTVAAAIEASLHNIPSIGFSLLDHSVDADFSHTNEFIIKLTERLLKTKLNCCLNVNIPKINKNQPIKGMKVAHQSSGVWIEEFEERIDLEGDRAFWLTGKFINKDISENSDHNLLEKNFVTIVPINHDLTFGEQIDNIKALTDE